MSLNNLPEKFYKQVIQSIPIATIDIVIIRNGRQFLLTKRKNKPFKGKWFLPGGRIQYGEMMMDAIGRQVNALGIHAVESIDFLCISEIVNPPGPTGAKQHSIWHVFVVRVDEYVEPEVDEESTTVKWFHAIDPSWPQPTIEILMKAGFTAPEETRSKPAASAPESQSSTRPPRQRR